MKYRLGLDMGTNSIGFAIVELNNENMPIELKDMGVRIFSDGRNPKDNQPLALQRRMARGLRRQTDRRIQRKKQIVQVLAENNLFPTNENEKEALKSLNPYRLRVEALDRKLDPYELGRALFHLGSRRGFQSNRLCNQQENENSTGIRTKLTQSEKINKLASDIKNSGCRTIGEFLYKRIQNGEVARFRGDEFEGYPSRSLYKEEFTQIINKQKQFYSTVNWEKIYQAIFYQRPLKQQERGRCQFYAEEYRAYKALPSAQKFRIVEEVNNLKYYDLEGLSHSLTDDQKELLISVLDDCKSKNFNSIRKLLKLDYKFNLEDGKRTDLKGNETSYYLRQEDYIGSQWNELPLEIQDEIVDLLIDSQTNEEILENEYFANLSMTEEQKQRVLSLKLAKNVGNLSAKFMRDCLPVMEVKHIRYDEAVQLLGLHHSFHPITELQDSLPYYGEVLTSLVSNSHPQAEDSNIEYKYGKIANPTVHIALNQLRKVVNSIINDYGKPEQIVVELSRDISSSAEQRAEQTKEQKQREKENLLAVEDIKKIAQIEHPSSWDIKKYKLWKELGTDALTRCCPYCGKGISGSQLFTKEIEIEHILPYSRTMMDSMGNLTVAHTSCNLKKGNRTPYEAFSSSPDGFNWKEIMDRAQKLPGKKSKMFTKDAIKSFDDGEQGFIERQLNDNRYISKAAKDYLACICSQNNIWGIPGKMTSELRYKWGLNSILNNSGNSKNRADHRHHSIDALVVALTDRALLQKIVLANENNIDPKKIAIPDMPFPRTVVENAVASIFVSFKPNHGHQGRIFLETATGMKLVRKTIAISELKESVFSENLIVKPEDAQLLKSLVEEKSSFKSALKEFKKIKSEETNSENPCMEVFEKKWVTKKDITTLDDKDINSHRILNKKLDSILYDRTRDVITDKKALAERLSDLSNELGVKRVRYIPFSQEYERINSVPNKWYALDGVCFVTIWRIPGEKPAFKGQFIDYHLVYMYDAGKIQELPKPHPAAKKVMTLYKYDIIKIKPNDSDKEYYARIAGFSATNNRIDIQPLCSADSIKEWKETTNMMMSSDWKYWDKPADGQNFKSINVLFSENEIRLAKISPSGKVIY